MNDNLSNRVAGQSRSEDVKKIKVIYVLVEMRENNLLDVSDGAPEGDYIPMRELLIVISFI